MNECSICFHTIDKNVQYAKIDNPDETGKYHVHCLEQWLKSSNNNGIMTRNKISAYFICANDIKLSKISINNSFTDATAPPLEYDNQETFYSDPYPPPYSPPVQYQQESSQYQQVQQPYQQAYCPDSQVHCPDSQVHCPDSQVYCPDSQVHCPDSQVYCPDSQVYCPDSQVLSLNQQVLSLNQQVHQPYQQVNHYNDPQYINSNRYYHEDRCANRRRITACVGLIIVIIIISIFLFIYLSH